MPHKPGGDVRLSHRSTRFSVGHRLGLRFERTAPGLVGRVPTQSACAPFVQRRPLRVADRSVAHATSPGSSTR